MIRKIGLSMNESALKIFVMFYYTSFYIIVLVILNLFQDLRKSSDLDADPAQRDSMTNQIIEWK